MIIARKLQQVEPLPNPHKVNAKRLFDSEHAQIVHIELAPGEALRKHVTPVDVCFYVVQGQGEVEIGQEKVAVGRDTLVESPSGSPHLLRNTGDQPFRVLVIKAPRPITETKLL